MIQLSLPLNPSTTPLPSYDTTARQSVTDQDDPIQFSFAFAAATLSNQAATALNVHGATPQEQIAADPEGSPRQRAKTTTENRPLIEANTPSADPLSSGDVQEPVATHAKTTTTSAGTAAAARFPATSTSTSPLLGLASQGHLAPYQLGQTTRSQISGPNGVVAGASAASEASATVRGSVTKPSSAGTFQAAGTVEPFAEVLARRVNADQSLFRLRLDPPELGRVTGQVEIQSDRSMHIRLVFDSREGFDLFSSNEEAMRDALTDAGIDTADRQLTFDFSHREEGANAQAQNSSETIAPSERFPSPNFEFDFASADASRLIDVKA
ncbi:MAG: flagellar hook-length control protein FliK [Pseudomonadota bacterium]